MLSAINRVGIKGVQNRPILPSYNGKHNKCCYKTQRFSPLLPLKNDTFSGAKRAAPQRPREQPPSLPRSPSPLLGSMSSLQDVLKVNDTL